MTQSLTLCLYLPAFLGGIHCTDEGLQPDVPAFLKCPKVCCMCTCESMCAYVQYVCMCVCMQDSVFGFHFVNCCECLCVLCVCNYIGLWLRTLHLMWECVLVGLGVFLGIIDLLLMCGYVWAVLLLAGSPCPVGWSSGCL